MSNINLNNIIDVDDSGILANTPVVLIKSGDRDVAIPIMSYVEKSTTEVPKEPDYYMCSSVEGTTWTGERLVKKSDGSFGLSGDIREGLKYTIYTPEIGEVYTEDASTIINNAVIPELNRLYSSGYNSNDQCCLGSSYSSLDNILYFHRVPVTSDIISIDSYMHTIMIDSNGDMFGVGSSSNGKLGVGTSTSIKNLKKLNDKKWRHVSVNAYVSAAIDTDGKLWTCGTNNSNYCLGTSENNKQVSMSFVDTGLSNIVSADISNTHMVAVDSAGNLYASGNNTKGECLTGDTTAVKLIASSSIRGTLPDGSKPHWAYVRCGGNFTILMDDTGKLYSCGLNGSGQLGAGLTTVVNKVEQHYTDIHEVGATDADKARRYKSVSVGYAHVVAIDMDDNLWAWGLGTNYRLFTGSTTLANAPTATTIGKCISSEAGYDYTIAIDSKGILYGAGTNTNGQLGLGMKSTNIISSELGRDVWMNDKSIWKSLGRFKRFTSFAWKA